MSDSQEKPGQVAEFEEHHGAATTPSGEKAAHLMSDGACVCAESDFVDGHSR